MTRPISKSDLTRDQRKLLDACGPDAANHPLVLDGETLRFRGNTVIVYLRCSNKLDLNAIACMPACFAPSEFREFYRMMGYSLCGYLDIFGDQLAEEEQERSCK